MHLGRIGEVKGTASRVLGKRRDPCPLPMWGSGGGESEMRRRKSASGILRLWWAGQAGLVQGGLGVPGSSNGTACLLSARGNPANVQGPDIRSWDMSSNADAGRRSSEPLEP
jgi:hypothetical protein